MITLRPFQERAVQQYRESWHRGDSHMGVAPTAFGKSILMGYLASKLKDDNWRTVIVAHREALIDQNAKKAAMVDDGLMVEIERAAHVAFPRADVISASIQTLRGERAEECVKAWRADGRKIMLMVDECHHATAQTYRDFLALLEPEKHLGVTATPFRADDADLSDVYPLVGFDISRSEMIDDGWLAQPCHYVVRTGVSLEGVGRTKNDFKEKELVKAINVENRNSLIVAAAKNADEVLRDQHGQPCARAVCFTADVQHALNLEQEFREVGWQAKAIHAKTPIPERREWDRRLKEATSPTVLLSCGVLTEGWDVEQCNLGLFGRPTKSPVLMDQMIGRVLRFLEDKPEALVIDFEDDGAPDRIECAASFKLPRGWSAEGGSLREDERLFAGTLAESDLSLQTVLWTAKNRAELRYMVENKHKYTTRKLEREYLWWDLGTEARAVVGQRTMVVYRAPQGHYIAEWREGVKSTMAAEAHSVDQALAQAEMAIDRYDSRASYFLRQGERYEEPTEKQLQFLKRRGIALPDGATKHMVGKLIDEEIMKSNKLAEEGRVTFGKYKGHHVSSLPDHYLDWMVQQEWIQRKAEWEAIKAEYDRRYDTSRGLDFGFGTGPVDGLDGWAEDV